MKKLIICLAFIALVASKPTIPELYKQNNGYLTNDYSVIYNNAVKSGEFGGSSEAGDINNDGIADFIIGNSGYDNSKGIAYVIFGKKGTMRQFNYMDDFRPGDEGFLIKGSVIGQKLGFCAGSAGDVNGDGIDDFIIGSPNWGQDGMGIEAGAVYVIFGQKSSSGFPSTLDIDRLSPSQGFRIIGESGRNHLGYAVSGAGDVNGDGINDILIGAFSISRAYVIYGSKQGFTDMVLPPAAGKGFIIKGSGQDDFGSSVSKIGDFNGDGVDDVIIGAHVADSWTGRAYIVYGRIEGFPASIQASEGMTLKGILQGDNFGSIVCGAGDFNSDGLQDVVIGAAGANGGRGGAYVIMGSRQNPSVLSMSVTNTATTRGFNLMSSFFSQLGMAVNGGKDLNGDGVSDIILGAPAWKSESGAVYIIYGSKAGAPLTNNFWLDNALSPSQGFSMVGTQDGSRYGQFVRILGDINSDGANDFLVSAWNANGGKGAVNVFYLPWKCMDRCSQCSKPDTCDSCVSGFGLLNNDCVSCPRGAYSLVNGVCVKCSANCGSCSRPNSCDYCAQGFGFLDSQCVTCPAATHVLSGGSCITRCPANCKQCSSSSSCDTCNDGFGFIGNSCSVCPADSYFLKNGYCIEIQDPFKVIKDFFGGWF